MKHLCTIVMALLAVALNAHAQSDSLSARLDSLVAQVEVIDEPDTARYMAMAAELRKAAMREHNNYALGLYYMNLISYQSHSLPVQGTRRALDTLDEFRAMVESTGSSRNRFYDSWQNIVNTLRNNNDISQAVKQLRLLLSYADEHNDDYGLAMAYMAFGDFYAFTYDEAIRNYEKAVHHMQRAECYDDLWYTYYSMACVAHNNSKYEETLRFVDQMVQSEPDFDYVQQEACRLQLQTYVKMRYGPGATEAYDQLKRLWDNGKIDSSIKSSVATAICMYLCRYDDPDKAVAYFDHIDDTKDDERIECQIAYLSAKGNYSRALQLTEEQMEMHRRQLSEMLQAEVANANAAYEYDQLERKNTLLELERIKTQNQRNIIIIIALCAILVLRFYFRRIQQHLKKMLRIEKKTAEELREAKTKIDAELGVAQRIQQGMLPRPVELPTSFSINALMTPAKEVGGDFYNYLRHGDKLYFVIADVSGKGVPAALFMARATELFMVAAPGEFTPNKIVEKINRQMCRDNDQQMFITMIVGILDMANDTLQMCNAGHNPPFIGTQELDLPKNIPVGLFDSFGYKNETIHFPAGSRLLLYTDGVTEAENVVKEQFGEERLKDIISASPSGTDLCTTIEQAVHNFAGDAVQSDDITVMVIEKQN